MYSGKLLLFYPVFLISLLGFIVGCTAIKWNNPEGPLKPDLTIRKISFRILPSSLKKRPYGRVTIPPWVEREFILIIENIGNGDWTGDLLIGYSRSEAEYRSRVLSGFRKIALLNKRLPFASRREIVFTLKLAREMKQIRFMVNPPVPDSLGVEFKRGEESFYGNNEYILKL